MGRSKREIPAWRSLAWGVLVAAGLFALYFVRLGSYPLIDPDEPVDSHHQHEWDQEDQDQAESQAHVR